MTAIFQILKKISIKIKQALIKRIIRNLINKIIIKNVNNKNKIIKIKLINIKIRLKIFKIIKQSILILFKIMLNNLKKK